MSFHKIFWGTIAAGLLVSSTAMAQTELTVYTAVEAEDLKRYAETFNVDHPDIKINWVRDSTGIVTAKLLAEKNNPQADVVWAMWNRHRELVLRMVELVNRPNPYC